MAVMEKMQKTKIDPEAAQTEADLDDILDQINDTHLQNSGDENTNAQSTEMNPSADADDEEL